MNDEEIYKHPLRIYRNLEKEQTVMFGDPAESSDYCSAVVFSKKYMDCPIVFNQLIDSAQFGYEMYYIAKYVYNKTNMWPKLAVERNTGQATIYVLKTLNYPNLFRMVDFTALDSAEKGQIGWVTTGYMRGGELQGTRKKMLDDLALAIKQKQIRMYDKQQIQQLKDFVIVRGGRAQAAANKKDDIVFGTAGCWEVHLVTPSEFLDDYDESEMWQMRQKWRFR